MQLTDDHIDIIIQKLHSSGIADEMLCEDLLDHICSYLEENNFHDFDTALQEATTLLAPNGIHEIEEEKYFLFHFKKQTTMKRILFFSGFFTTFFITTGITFKLMHWPGATVSLFSGYMGLLFTVLLISINTVKNLKIHSVAFNVRIFIGLIAGILISTGSIFKLQQWPYANIQFVLGMLLLNFIFLPMFFYQLYRQSLTRKMV